MSAAHPARPFGRLDPAAKPVPKHRLVLGARGLAALAVSALALCGWAAGATYFVLYSDDIAGRAIANQRALQIDYEERLAALRARLDQTTREKIAEQQQIESRISALGARQAEIDSRHQILATLLSKTAPGRATASLPAAATAFTAARTPVTASTLASQPLGLRLRESSPESTADAGRPRVLDEPARTLPDRISGLEHALGGQAEAQSLILRSLAEAKARKAAKLRAVVAETGIDPADLGLGPTKGGTGGPFVPVGQAEAATGFQADLAMAKAAIAEWERLRQTIDGLPLGRPTAAELDVTSGFGIRLDPFTRTLAQHTGIDFRAQHGSAVRATGAGRVSLAGPNGGYGRMVEIDHGNGVTTRYAHLSGISVSEGDQVAAGTVVGRAGSTGRSTGTHLHYETRIDGVPVDGQRFLKLGRRLKVAELE